VLSLSIRPLRVLALLTASAAILLGAPGAFAQVTPAAGYTPPDDTPAVKVGGTIFANYQYQDKPTATDADKNTIHPSSFDVARAYINVTGQVHHLVAFRITPDISRQTTTNTALPAGSSVSGSLDGSLVFRLKYAYGQFNLDDVLPKGSWIRLGVQQTPWVDFMENVYRYRFQGTIFEDREGFLSSSDFGLSGRLAFPDNYGELHLGLYNGETYTKPEANDQKAFQARLTVRPLPADPLFKGLRLTGFLDLDKYVKSADRTRFVGGVTYEHKYVNVGVDYLNAKDQTSATRAPVKADGFSFWVTPRSTVGLEGVVRYDSLKPNKTVDAKKNRTIVGVSYWFKTIAAPATAALLADYEHVSYDTALARPEETRFFLHLLVNF
jgi:hypothetical protein